MSIYIPIEKLNTKITLLINQGRSFSLGHNSSDEEFILCINYFWRWWNVNIHHSGCVGHLHQMYFLIGDHKHSSPVLAIISMKTIGTASYDIRRWYASEEKEPESSNTSRLKWSKWVECLKTQNTRMSI